MPRNENPLDPLAGPVAEFAADLRALRHQAGHMTYRVMAKRTGYSVSTLSVAASGASLPSLEVTLAYVQACGGDPQMWEPRWQQTAAQRQRQQRDGADTGPSSDHPAADPALHTENLQTGITYQSENAHKRRRPGLWAIGAAVEAGLLAFAMVGVTYGRTAQPTPPVTSVSGTLNAPAPFEQAPEHCTMPTWEPVPEPVPSGGPPDVQHLSDWIMWPGASGVPLILLESTPVTSSSATLGQLSANIDDGLTADYADTRTTDGDVPGMTVNVATPKAGTCMAQLIDYAEVGLMDGRQDTNPSNLTFLTPGPLLKAAHAVLLCSDYYVAAGIPTTCAWAGPVTGSGTPFFGQYWVHPERSGPPQQYLASATADYADQLFGVLNAAPPRSVVVGR